VLFVIFNLCVLLSYLDVSICLNVYFGERWDKFIMKWWKKGEMFFLLVLRPILK